MIDDPDLEMVVDLMSPDYQEAAHKEEAAFFKALRKEEAALAKAEREVKKEEAALAKALKKEEAALAKALKEEAALTKDGIKRKRKYKLCLHPDGCEKSAQDSAVGGSGFSIAHRGGNRCQHPKGCSKSAEGGSGLCRVHFFFPHLSSRKTCLMKLLVEDVGLDPIFLCKMLY